MNIRSSPSVLAIAALVAGAAAPCAVASPGGPCRKHCMVKTVTVGTRDKVACNAVAPADPNAEASAPRAACCATIPACCCPDAGAKASGSQAASTALRAVAPGPLAMLGPALMLASVGSDEQGWLGIQLGEVPAPLAAHLGLEDQGVLIVNVVEDGPAGKAGLQRWDIITAIDGKPVHDCPGLAAAIGAQGADASIELSLMRAGESQTVSVTLGKRPGDIKRWKHPWEPGTFIEEYVNPRARIMMRGPGGAWALRDLSDLDELKDLPAEIKKLLGRFRGITTRIYRDDEHNWLKLNVVRDGETVEIERDDAGRITVRRTVKDGDDETTVEKTYDDDEALRQGDQDAYELYARMQEPSGFGLRGFCDPDRCITTDLLDCFKDRAGWQVEIRKTLKEAQEAAEEAAREAEEARRRARTALTGTPDGVTHSFRVADDGKIEVTIRKGDAEIVEVFRNEEDLEARNPDLFERFDGVRSTPAD